MVQRRLRAGTGVEHRASEGREPPQENLRQAAGDRLVTSHRLKPRPVVLTPSPPVETWRKMWSKSKQESCAYTGEQQKHSAMKWSDDTMQIRPGQASHVLTDVVMKLLSFSSPTATNKLTFLARPDPLDIRQDVVYSHHLSFNQRADRGQTILLNNLSVRLWKTRTKTPSLIHKSWAAQTGTQAPKQQFSKQTSLFIVGEENTRSAF